MHKKDRHTRPEIILASFPRSGNTYLRNILYDVYGVFSWNNIDKFHQAFERIASIQEMARYRELPEKRKNKLNELKYKTRFFIVKTHELPKKILPECDPDAKIVYLIRDGRDALVSIAHHRKDIIEPGTDYVRNLKEAIIAARNSYFGGWSENVREWTKIADVVIRFEALVEEPLETVERLRGIIDLPLPDTRNIPTFDSQRQGKSHFGGSARVHRSVEDKKIFNNKFFRSGKTGGWRNEMPAELHQLFWKKHGKVSEELGYLYDGQFDRLKW